MKARKTIDVETVRKEANTYLELSHDDRAEQRLGVASLLERVLLSTGNYKGFRYRDGAEAVDAGTHDESRRYYYGR